MATCHTCFIFNVDGDNGNVQLDGRLCSECDAEATRVPHEPGKEPAKTRREKKAQTCHHSGRLHHKLVSHVPVFM